MAKINICSGTTGPRHDPYGWEELQFTKTDGTLIILHSCGLRGDSLEVNGETQIANCYGSEADDLFTELVGVTPHRMERIYHERFYAEDPFGPASRYE